MPLADYSSYHQNTGTTSDGAKFNNLIDAVQATVNGLDNANIAANAAIAATKLAAVPACRVFHSAVQSIPDTTSTALSFDSERFDTDTMHDPVTNNSRITVHTAGKYLVGALVQFASNSVGYRQVIIEVNGSSFVTAELRPAISGTGSQITTDGVWDAAANDFFQVFVAQTSGGALNTGTFCEFWATRLSA